MKQYAMDAWWVKLEKDGSTTRRLQLDIINAVNEEEALGRGISTSANTGFTLEAWTVKEITEEPLIELNINYSR